MVAISYYDTFYSHVYGEEEYRIRIRPALLSPPQYLALPNPFTSIGEQLSKHLREVLGALSLKEMVYQEDFQDKEETGVENQGQLQLEQISSPKWEVGFLQFLKGKSKDLSKVFFV